MYKWRLKLTDLIKHVIFSGKSESRDFGFRARIERGDQVDPFHCLFLVIPQRRPNKTGPLSQKTD
jgi:hypothetical protein